MYTADSPIVGKSTIAAEAIDAFFVVIGKERAKASAPDGTYQAPPAGLGAAIIAASRLWDTQPDYTLVAAQCLHETGGWQSYWARSCNNPAGIGVDGTPGVGEVFTTFAGGFLAQVAHLLDYAVSRGAWTTFDRRANAMPVASFGIAPTLHGLDGRWAVPGLGYGAAIADMANRLVDFANHGAWNVTVDISGYVPPQIVSQPFAVNGVSYLGEDMQMWGVCIHETGNTAAGAEAQQNVDYMNTQACIQRQASWHATVGHDEVIETIPHTKQAYHASDGSGPGNTHFVAIEGVMCYAVGTPEFQRVMMNHAWYAAKCLHDAGLDDVYATQDAPFQQGWTVCQHNTFARDHKDCPQFYRDHGLWGQFCDYVAAFHTAMTNGSAPQPATPPRPAWVKDDTARYFPETQQWQQFAFKAFWETHGGLTVFGYPVTAEVQDNGMTVQYYERNVFEYHPNNDADNQVQLRRLGSAAAAAAGFAGAGIP